jgi:hypothetical protein
MRASLLEYQQAEEVLCKMSMVERNDQWNITSKAWKNTYRKYSWWKDEMVKEALTPKTHVLGELNKYAIFALSYLDKALELHFKNPFRKWCFKTYIFKQKTIEKKLQRITTKKSQRDNKQVIFGFGN